jgi:pimeloyl-ACP methyl ester carboxylesterase
MGRWQPSRRWFADFRVSDARSIVILVHGVWMHGVTMELQRFYLAQSGFDAQCYSYHSVSPTLSENAQRLADYAHAQSASEIHWVGHSLGGLVILRMLECAPDLPPGRIVLMGTPFQGSYAARMLATHQFGEMALGNSLAEWFARDKPAGFPGREIGIIAGTSRFGLGALVAPDLPGPNDGAVSVEETLIPGALDHIVLPVSHSGMLVSHAVAVQTGAFLRNARFDHDAVAD